MPKIKYHCIWKSERTEKFCPRLARGGGLYCKTHAPSVRKVELKTKPTKRFIRQMERFARNRTRFDLTIKGEQFQVVNNELFQNGKSVIHMYSFVRKIGGVAPR